MVVTIIFEIGAWMWETSDLMASEEPELEFEFEFELAAKWLEAISAANTAKDEAESPVRAQGRIIHC